MSVTRHAIVRTIRHCLVRYGTFILVCLQGYSMGDRTMFIQSKVLLDKSMKYR